VRTVDVRQIPVLGCDGGTGAQGRGRTLGGGGQSFDEIFARYQGPIYRYTSMARRWSRSSLTCYTGRPL